MTALPESAIPAIRRRELNDVAWRSDGDYVVYWMIANRRAEYNFALQRAVELCLAWDRPLVVFEPLRCTYRWASDRVHRFVIEGMRDNAAAFADSPAHYYPYVEPRRHASQGLLKALAKRACGVIVDDDPMFFLPTMVGLAVRHVEAAFEAVDSLGIMPVWAAGKAFARAYDFRRYVQKNVLEHLKVQPEASPLHQADIPEAPDLDTITNQWPAADLDALLAADGLRGIEIDHTLPPVTHSPGGAEIAGDLLDRFLEHRLSRYDEDRNAVDEESSSNLAPYMHFGHVSSHEMFARLTATCSWKPGDVADKAKGQREGWWNMPAEIEAFLDQIITWREVSQNGAAYLPRYMYYDSLPNWAQETLADHRDDPRDPSYSLEQLDQADTYDEIWNAAQRQLVQEGRIHNYLRMLWGKKILEWSATPQDALKAMVHLNNRYALDGRDPNSYSGIFWCLGRYDRAWGPERPIFGKVRYMSSDSTRRKLSLKNYLEKFGPGGRQASLFEED